MTNRALCLPLVSMAACADDMELAQDGKANWETWVTRKFLLLIILGTVLCGCTSMTPIQPVGRDRFMVSSTTRGGLTTDGQIKMDLMQRARDFCGKREMVLESSTSGGTQGWTPQTAELLFKCEGGP